MSNPDDCSRDTDHNESSEVRGEYDIGEDLGGGGSGGSREREKGVGRSHYDMSPVLAYTASASGAPPLHPVHATHATHAAHAARQGAMYGTGRRPRKGLGMAAANDVAMLPLGLLNQTVNEDWMGFYSGQPYGGGQQYGIGQSMLAHSAVHAASTQSQAQLLEAQSAPLTSMSLDTLGGEHYGYLDSKQPSLQSHFDAPGMGSSGFVDPRSNAAATAAAAAAAATAVAGISASGSASASASATAPASESAPVSASAAASAQIHPLMVASGLSPSRRVLAGIGMPMVPPLAALRVKENGMLLSDEETGPVFYGENVLGHPDEALQLEDDRERSQSPPNAMGPAYRRHYHHGPHAHAHTHTHAHAHQHAQQHAHTHEQHQHHQQQLQMSLRARRRASRRQAAQDEGHHEDSGLQVQSYHSSGERQIDGAGVPWLLFDYPESKAKRQSYRVRCDIEALEVSAFDDRFRQLNCVYPKAMVAPEEYSGHRQGYETKCNEIGWKLVYLNPLLTGQRGLIQRAVDTYRNTNDLSTRSRRARRIARQQQKSGRLLRPPDGPGPS